MKQRKVPLSHTPGSVKHRSGWQATEFIWRARVRAPTDVVSEEKPGAPTSDGPLLLKEGSDLDRDDDNGATEAHTYCP